MAHLPTWIPGVVTRLVERFWPKRPKLSIEIRQVCFDRILASLEVDWTDYQIDLYLFLYVWVVNTEEVPTTVKAWNLSVGLDEQNVEIEGEQITDFSKWHQHSKVKAVQHGLQVVQDIRETVPPFPVRPLQLGIPSEGWVCFVIRKTKESIMEHSTVTLTTTDSFERNYSANSRAPWTCKGDMVNPDMPF